MNNRHVDDNAIMQLKKNWAWYMTGGVVFIALGTLAVVFSLLTTILSVLYLGIFFIIVGIFEGLHALTISRWGSFFLHIILSIFYIIGGLFFITNPASSALSLTLFLGIFFILSGSLKIIFSLITTTAHNGLLFCNGILTLILGILIWYEWPYSGLWIIGTLVGINTIMTGWMLIILSLTAKNLPIK